jgi:DNA-directed RNA polymerase specialized sigma24 family protein
MSFAWHEIRDQIMQSASTLNFQRSFDAIRRDRDQVVPFRDPTALLDALHQKAGSPDQKNLILVGLARAAHSEGHTGDCALTLMLLALWPGLDAIRRRCIWRKVGTGDEITADILGRTTEAIRGLDLQRVNWIAATILRNVERDILRAHQREAGRQNLRSETEPDEIAAEDGSDDAAISEAQLLRDLWLLVGADAILVIRVAVEGFSQAEAGVELGLSEAAARKRYQRATQRLRDALQKIH